MCGLAGWFGLRLSDVSRQEELLRLLMRKAQIRGTDSFGLAFGREGRTRVHRGLGPVSIWLTKDRKRVRRVASSSIVVGHTRAASRGDVTIGNAHPFRVGEWVGAHNGCLQNSGELMVAAKYAPKGETDSEEALSWLATNEFSKEAFRALRGWYAMTVLKADTSELLIAVDARTPFAIAEVPGGGVVWHSLAIALESSLRAVGIDAEVQEVKNTILRFPSGEAVDLSPEEIPKGGPREIDTGEVRRMLDAEELQMEMEGFDA